MFYQPNAGRDRFLKAFKDKAVHFAAVKCVLCEDKDKLCIVSLVVRFRLVQMIDPLLFFEGLG